MASEHGSGHIIQSLVSNVIIASAKFAAAIFTGSGALLAEAIHTAADSSNQVLLLIGLRLAKKPPSKTHPLGYGREVYFWSFQVALLLFTLGGMFSIYEGVHKLEHPEPITKAWMGFAILGFTLVLEIFVTWGNIKQINQQRNGRGFLKCVVDSKDSDLIVVFGENVAALFGTVLALGAFFLSWRTGDGRFDAIGSILVGSVLVLVAIFLAIEVKSLLIGEAAAPEIVRAAEAIAVEDPRVDAVSELITVQQGPGEVLVALKIACAKNLSASEVSRLINEYEARLRERCPQAKWLFVEPDIDGGPPSVNFSLAGSDENASEELENQNR